MESFLEVITQLSLWVLITTTLWLLWRLVKFQRVKNPVDKALAVIATLATWTFLVIAKIGNPEWILLSILSWFGIIVATLKISQDPKERAKKRALER